MDPRTKRLLHLTRRHLFGLGFHAVGTAALAGMMAKRGTGAPQRDRRGVGSPDIPHHPPTAKRMIYLFMGGGPAQMDLFDYKPELDRMFDKDLPESVRLGQRFTTMTSGQKSFPVNASQGLRACLDPVSTAIEKVLSAATMPE